MILEEHGYTCEEGILYFSSSKERVRVAFDEELRNLTLSAIRYLLGDLQEVPGFTTR
jgi:CRISPR/Cas system-associated exonuclease Cas4 (RecB family)